LLFDLHGKMQKSNILFVNLNCLLQGVRSKPTSSRKGFTFGNHK